MITLIKSETSNMSTQKVRENKRQIIALVEFELVQELLPYKFSGLQAQYRSA